MAMSAAERARKYRERIKNDPHKHKEYLKKGSEWYKDRKKKGKIASTKNLDSERDKRLLRRKWRVNKAKDRAEKRRLAAVIENVGTPPQSPGPEVPCGSQNVSLRQMAATRRVRKDRAKAYRTINKLKQDLLTKEKCIEKFRKQSYRLRVTLRSTDMSPRSKTTNMLSGQTVDSNVRKALLFHNTLVNQVRQSYRDTKSRSTRKNINVLRSRLLRKYRLIHTAARTLGVSRKSLDYQRTKDKPIQAKFMLIKRHVSMFYNRDDISRIKAGKKETITRNKIKKQKRLLDDSMKNLHLKCLMEFKDFTISYSLFCRLRPFWALLLPTIGDRETCQCKLHANAQFMADTLRTWKAIATLDIEKLVEETHCNSEDKSCMYGDCLDCKNKLFSSAAYDPGKQVSWFQWQDRVEMLEINKEARPVKRTVKGEVFGTLEQFRTDFQAERPKLSRHLFNIRHQYRCVRNLRENQLENTAIVHMDFSENFGCKYGTEIQSVHFGAHEFQAKPDIDIQNSVR